jgi:mannosyltransferase OCH1-like enzyme
VVVKGFIASCPGHPIFKKCIERLQYAKVSDDFTAIIEATGPFFFSQCVYDSLNERCGKIVIFPVSFFYPMPAAFRFEKLTLEEAMKRFIKDESYAIHWWYCSWQH